MSIRFPTLCGILTTCVPLVDSVFAGWRIAGGTGQLGMREALLLRVDMLVGRPAERRCGTTIVYMTQRATATMFAEMLCDRVFQQEICYHAGM